MNIDFSKIMELIAAELDIPESKCSLAEERYKAVGEWISGGFPESHKPQIYVQGSFLLGTVVRPFRRQKDAAYDIDLICQLPFPKEKSSEYIRTIKHSVGNRLKEHSIYERMLDEEGKRCWTLDYSKDENIGFHLDILPCVLEQENTSPIQYRSTEIAATTKNKESNIYSWNSTNPKAFAEWFKEQSKILLREQLSLSASRDSIAPVPQFSKKTTLQRIVQILKRHRDVRFDGHIDADDAPISMIITVLSAYLYNHESNIFRALADISQKLTEYSRLLTERYDVLVLSEHTRDYNIITRDVNGIWHLNNPVAHENFAERWHENGNKKAKAFFLWCKWIREDIVIPIEQGNMTAFLNTCKMLMPDIESRTSSFSEEIKHLLRPQYILSMPPKSFFQLKQRQPLKYEIRINPSNYVKISCMATRAGWRSINYSNNGNPIPKGYSLKFTAKTDISHPDAVLWQVVNTGTEAEKANCLRGDFYNNEGIDAVSGGYIRKEPTSYTGSHWVECFIIKDGICRARSGEFLVNIQ
ncbi:MAG: nucleotidyltransferase [Kiritimatiellales bacterium]